MYLRLLLDSIEWEAYDLHSGIKEVYWKIFDNFTNTDVVHGHQNIGHQGKYDVSIGLSQLSRVWLLKRR